MTIEIIQSLKKTTMFQDLPEETLSALAEVVRPRALKNGEILFRKGEPGDSLCLIARGALKIVAEDMDLVINQVGEGEGVGEMSLFDEAPRSANVVSSGETEILELKRQDFLSLIDKNPDVALGLMRSMTARMRFNTTLIEKMTEWSKRLAAEDYSFMNEAQAKDASGGTDEARARKFLSAFFEMARDVKERERKISPLKRMQKIEPDLRYLLDPQLYAEIYLTEWADQSENAPKRVHPKTGKEIEPDLYNGYLLEPVFNHLVALQKTLSDYASSLITEQRKEDKKVKPRNGALMFTDLAGFTKLMESNAGQGREGATMLFNALTNYFTEIIEIIGKSGGDLLEFTGDALLVFFPAVTLKDEEKSFKEMQNAVAKAARAGLRMQKKMLEKFSAIPTASGETIALQMRIGVHAGYFYSADVGAPRRREHVLLGKNVQEAKRTEGYGANGRVNFTPMAYGYIRELTDKKGQKIFEFEPNPEHEGYMLLKDTLQDADGYELGVPTTRRLASAMLTDKGFNNTYEQIQNLLAAIKELASFIPAPVLSLLVESAARRLIVPDFLSPTVMFVNFIGLPEMIEERDENGELIYDGESVIATFNEFFSKLNAIVERRGGMLKKVTYHLTGSDIVIYFGVPTAHTNDPLRAASAAVDVRELIRYINRERIPARRDGTRVRGANEAPLIYSQIGINTGPTFAAEFGAKRSRREYNVLGDTVNTTARLMSKAKPNQILISEAIKNEIEEKYECVLQEPMKLKGKSQQVVIYELVGKKS